MSEIIAAEQDREGDPRPPSGPDQRHVLLSMEHLPHYGIIYTRDHLRRLWKRGLFPVPVQVSEHRIAWRLPEIIRWIEARPPVTEAPPKEARAAETARPSPSVRRPLAPKPERPKKLVHATGRVPVQRR